MDLAHEARNSEKMLAYVLDDAQLKNSVFIPRIVWEYTGASVMTAEYVVTSHPCVGLLIHPRRLQLRPSV